MTSSPRIGRRALLGGTAAGLLLTGCGKTAAPTAKRGPRKQRIRYATQQPADQYADLWLPGRTPLATIVLIHGGYWLEQYAADQMDAMAEVLRSAGYAVWNIEYRRLGDGGGWPATFEDTAAAIDHLAKLDPARAGIATEDLLRRVVSVGHSAGGQLAAWAASRTSRTPGGTPLVRPDATISLSGVLNLVLGEQEGLGDGVIDELLDGPRSQVPDHYALSDPTLLVPARGPVQAVQATSDQVVPANQASTYVEAVTLAGGTAEVVDVPGGHFDLILPSGPGWPRIEALITTAATGR